MDFQCRPLAFDASLMVVAARVGIGNSDRTIRFDHMRQMAKRVTEKFIATYDPTMPKLYDEELARIHK